MSASLSSQAVPFPGLLLLTGASHTGKTTVAQEIIAKVRPPTALLSVDNVLAGAIVKPHKAWADIPLAYDLLVPQLELLLDRGWFVILESTFTFVPDQGEPEFHGDQIHRMISIAASYKAPWRLVQLNVGDRVARERAEHTGRLTPQIVDRTAELHQAAALPSASLQVDATAKAPADIACRVLSLFDEPSSIA